jgi:hypothetical protein
MKTRLLPTMTCLIGILLSGCSKPDQVTTIKSPVEGVFFTVETFHGHGAADSDFTWVYAHLERNGKSRKVLVLSGTYLTVSKIVWVAPHEDTICIDGGITDTFRNEVTLIAGDVSETIRSHLNEHCGDVPTATPNVR